jgi:hypothetical protein
MTPQQKAAYEQLDEAIKTALQTFGMATGILTDYVIVCAQQNFADDGSSTTRVSHVTSGDGMPYYRLLGLLDFTRVAVRGEIVRTLGGGDD